MREVVIVGMARTAIGRFQGALSSQTGPQLGAVAIEGALERAGVDKADVDEVIMGEVLTAGVGQAPARQAALYAGLPNGVPCMTINKVCGSGLKAVMLARQAIALGDANIVVAGGMESMSNAPYLLPDARGGMRMGNKGVVDSMINDGLWDPYGNQHMGNFGDACAKDLDIDRASQDEFAKASYERARAAQESGDLGKEIVPVTIKGRKATTVVEADEEPANYRPEKMGGLRAAFSKDGSVTAANASKINDGAAALVLMSREEADKRGLSVIASLVADATHAQEPSQFTTAPVGAMKKVFEKSKLAAGDIDLFEINEAFAMVTLAAMQQLELPHEKVNVYGGAIALGHPIGASGARVLITLLNAMQNQDAKTGCASLCIGGGEAVALVVRR